MARTMTITVEEYSKLLECRIRTDILRDYLEEDSYVSKSKVEQILGKPENETEPIPGTEDDEF